MRALQRCCSGSTTCQRQHGAAQSAAAAAAAALAQEPSMQLPPRGSSQPRACTPWRHCSTNASSRRSEGRVRLRPPPWPPPPPCSASSACVRSCFDRIQAATSGLGEPAGRQRVGRRQRAGKDGRGRQNKAQPSTCPIERRPHLLSCCAPCGCARGRWRPPEGPLSSPAGIGPPTPLGTPACPPPWRRSRWQRPPTGPVHPGAP